jgi:hypothetical protein
VLACPSNSYGHSIPGTPGAVPPGPGMNAEGWEVEPGQKMPISYAMNACASTWYPADTVTGQASPPLRLSQLQRPADTIIIGETAEIWPDIPAYWMVDQCDGLFAHSAGQVANFIFYSGHAKSKKWLSTLYPQLSEATQKISAEPPVGDPAAGTQQDASRNPPHPERRRSTWG